MGSALHVSLDDRWMNLFGKVATYMRYLYDGQQGAIRRGPQCRPAIDGGCFGGCEGTCAVTIGATIFNTKVE